MRAHSKTFKVKHMPSIESRYYLRFIIKDEAGTLARITKVLGDHDISISDCVQKERNVGNAVSLIVLTHDAHEKDVRAAIKIIDRLKQLRGSSQVIRIENSN
jgi:homoserine dehydrogenase